MSEEKKTEFEFDVSQLIDKKRVTDSIMVRLNEDIANSVYYNVQEIVKKQILEIIEPELKNLVVGQKEAILNGVIDAMPEVAKALAETIVAKANKNLNGYGSDDIIRKIFN